MRILPRFSLRTFLIGMALLAAFAGWQGQRYARYRDRAAGVIALKEHGVYLTAQHELHADHKARCIDPPPDNIFARWDEYWFGPESKQFYPRCGIMLDKWMEASGKPHANDIGELLRRFPEIQLVYIQSPDSQGRWANKFEQPRPELGVLWQAIAQLPNVRRLHAYALDDRWAAALPSYSKLIELTVWRNYLTAQGVLSFLQRAPELQVLDLPIHLLNEPLVAELNRRDCWRGTPFLRKLDHHSNKPWPAALIINCWSQRNKTEPEIPEIDHDALRQLDVDYSLILHDNSGTLEFAFTNCQARYIDCSNCGSFKLVDCPRLEQAAFYGTKRLEIQNCAKLTTLHAGEFRRAVIGQNAVLRDLNLERIKDAEVDSCDLIDKLHSTSSISTMRSGPSSSNNTVDWNWQGPMLRLSRLPALRSIRHYHSGIVVDDSRLIQTLHMESTNIERIESLASLRHLRRLSLGAIYGDVDLRPLQQFPELEQLSFGYPYGNPDNPPSGPHIPDLRELQTLKIVSVGFSYSVDKAFTKLDEQGKYLSLLPAGIDVLILGRDRFIQHAVPQEDFAKLKSLHPNLTVIDTGEQDPATQKPRITWDMLGSQHEPWKVEQLRGFAAQWWQELKPEMPKATEAK